MRIAILANLKKNAPRWEGMPKDRWDDLDSPITVESITAALEKGGHEARYVAASIYPPNNMIEELRAYKPDLCFNIAEGHFGDGRESHVPAILEMLQIPYTGSRVTALAVALDKPLTKRILLFHGLPTPEFQVFERADEPLDSDLVDSSGELLFPMFVKPSREGTSMGASMDSIVSNVAQLRQQVAKQLALYKQPILVEHYIHGREITVGLIGNLEPTSARKLTERTSAELPSSLTFLPALEVDFEAHGVGGVYSSYLKTGIEVEDFKYLCPAPLEADMVRELQRLAASIFRVLDCKDVSRVDFRLDANNGNKPYLLEINPLPGLYPGFSDLTLQAYAAGWSYERLINTIVDVAAARHGLAHEPRALSLA
jgi:D-alanine-D-alanine ligase